MFRHEVGERKRSQTNTFWSGVAYTQSTSRLSPFARVVHMQGRGGPKVSPWGQVPCCGEICIGNVLWKTCSLRPARNRCVFGHLAPGGRKSTGFGLRLHPLLRATFVPKFVRRRSRIHLGVVSIRSISIAARNPASRRVIQRVHAFWQKQRPQPPCLAASDAGLGNSAERELRPLRPEPPDGCVRIRSQGCVGTWRPTQLAGLPRSPAKRICWRRR